MCWCNVWLWCDITKEDGDLVIPILSYFFKNRHSDPVMNKGVANGLVGQVSAGSLFRKVKTKFHFTKASNKPKDYGDFWTCSVCYFAIQ